MADGHWSVKPAHQKLSGSESRSSHNYGDCSSVGRVEDCGSFGHGFDPHHSPEIKYAVVAQLVEHVSEEHGVGCSIHSHRTNVQMAKLEKRVSLQN